MINAFKISKSDSQIKEERLHKYSGKDDMTVMPNHL